ncbi:MAG: NAD(P)/FAD-dependent oxidoreductase [Bacilli bacterium]|nr:NAD(P)/FAD-dependent oxidoreductase [Bacilli bacterium]
MDKKKVIIVGAGLSGLTAGIYCLDNDFDVEIYEKHLIPGGECTGWYREGHYIDGCAHWIVGTSPYSELYPLWERIGAFNDKSIIYPTEDITQFEVDGKTFVFYGDLEKLEKEMMDFFPEDKRRIKKFIDTVKRYQFVSIPVKKPLDKMNIFEFIPYGLHMLPMAFHFAHYRKVSVEDYAKKFKNKKLGELILRFMGPTYNIHSFFYIMQALSKNDAGVIEGGSLKMMKRVSDVYKENGGKLYLGKGVKKIIIEDNTAKGVELENGDKVYADYVISSADAYHTLNNLLDGKYTDKFFKERFDDIEKYPLNSSLQLSYVVDGDLSHHPKMKDYLIDPIEFAGIKLNHFAIRNFSFDKTISKNGKTIITILIAAGQSTYDFFASLSKEEYEKEKNRIGEIFKAKIVEKTDIKENEIKLLDVVTPKTYERYTNAYKGSYMSWITTASSKGLMRPGIIKGLKNFTLSGQWLMSPGGLPIALFTGKHAAMRLCYMEKKKFKCLEKPKKTGFRASFSKV